MHCVWCAWQYLTATVSLQGPALGPHSNQLQIHATFMPTYEVPHHANTPPSTHVATFWVGHWTQDTCI